MNDLNDFDLDLDLNFKEAGGRFLLSSLQFVIL